MRFRVHAVLLTLPLLLPGLWFPHFISAQAATLSGTATDVKGKPIANATISLKPSGPAPATEFHTDADGNYSIPNLVPGEYSIQATGDSLSSQLIKVTITTVAHQTLDLLLIETKPAQELPSAPTAAPASPSLEDLGFSAQQTQGNPQLQATLQKRTRMLKTHQRLGLITAIPMAATLITGPMAKAKGRNGETITEPSTANLDFHAALGGATTALYFTTAYYAIWAPRVPGTTKQGGIRWHEALAFVHGPGMVLTPVLGYMAWKQEDSGEKAHGIAAEHGTVAWITAAAYGTSIVAISWPIHWKFWEK